MCGVSAIISKAPGDLRRRIDAMTNSMAHRGPDDRGVAVFAQAGVALGMRRLSIVDLEGGQQPMYSDDSRYCLVFNGEIYNAPELRGQLLRLGQRFRTDHSDTEVLVHGFAAWHHSLWRRLNGMFAVIIWDREREVLIAARDRFGKKPLYVSQCAGGYALGSELKAVLGAPGVAREVDLVALEQYLTFDYVLGPRTMLAGTSKLPGGHYAEITARGAQWTPYWHGGDLGGEIPDGRRGRRRRPGLDTAVAELDRRLDTAVTRRLMSDVPLGLFLSGGLDSSTVGYYMRRHCADVQSFSIGFQESEYDESSYSSLAAKAIGTRHHLEVFSQDRLAELIPRIADVLDEPMGDQSILPTYLLSRFTQSHVKVALGGDGSDEVLMGYNTYFPLKVAWSLGRVPALPKIMATVARHSPDHLLGRPAKGIVFARQLDRRPWERLFVVLGHFAGDARWVLSPDVRRALPAPVLAEPASQMNLVLDGHSDGARETVLGYVRGYLQEDILVKVDRASMATSLEVRSPFLDPDLVDFALGLPVDLRLRGRTGKYLLRALMRGRLPDPLLDRPKVGFGVPLNRWLRESQRDLLLEHLSGARLRAQGIFDVRAVQQLISDHLRGSADHGHRLWLLLLFALWQERWLAPARGGEPNHGCDGVCAGRERLLSSAVGS